MKKSLVESLEIRLHVALWGMFLLGILIALPFRDTQSQWRYVSLAGFILCVLSFIVTTRRFLNLQGEIRERYPQADSGQKRFLQGLFYFSRGVFALLGIVILLFSSAKSGISSLNTGTVSGKIAALEVYGSDSSFLKITLEGNSNEYETRTFRIPAANLEQIKDELHPGDLVTLLIEDQDVSKRDNPFIQVYGIQTEKKTYFSLEEYTRSDVKNNQAGMVIGLAVAAFGAFLLLTGRIQKKKAPA